MIIILEGHDLSGKSSLALRLAKKHGKAFLVKNCHYNLDATSTSAQLVKSYQQINRWAAEFESSDNLLILDRSLLSELIYGMVLRGYNPLHNKLFDQALKELMGLKPMVFIFEADYTAIYERLHTRGDTFGIDDISSVKKAYRYFVAEPYRAMTKILVNNTIEDQETNLTAILENIDYEHKRRVSDRDIQLNLF